MAKGRKKMKIPWKLKSAIFAAIDLLSAPRLLYFLQKNVTKRSHIEILEAIESWKKHSSSLVKYDLRGTVFEFGAGKSLAQNLYLSGFVDKQIVVDLNPMVDLKLAEIARDLLSQQGQLKSNETISSLEVLARAYGIEYRAPYDASSTDFGDDSIDACVSTNTLEHVPKESIIKIFTELHRILKPDGIVSAGIDYSDHYAHTDASISPLNYLKYSEAEWAKYNHRCHYQNRLRHYDYLNIFEQCGFTVLEQEVDFTETEIPKTVSDQFGDMPDSWPATSAYVVLGKK